MGLTRESVGRQATDPGLEIRRGKPESRVVALAGNPNVGKSTVFNALTGMHQHTGNWPGKTVTGAQGVCRRGGREYVLVDVPGCYSLLAHSPEEEVARDFICFGQPDAVIVVCDATCLERNLNLVLQVMEAVPRVVVCVNLMDEAKKKGLALDLEELSRRLGTPVVAAAARSGRGLDGLLDAVETACSGHAQVRRIPYPEALEQAIEQLLPAAEAVCPPGCSPRWLCARLLDGDSALRQALWGGDPVWLGGESPLEKARKYLSDAGWDARRIQDTMAAAFVGQAEELCRGIVRGPADYRRLDRRLDAVFTSRAAGFPLMLTLLCLLFWITVTGANIPSELLSRALFRLEGWLASLWAGSVLPGWLGELLIGGVFRTVAWIISVMLPPMAIFFPLFTLLEDSGYLPRVAFNLDRCFQKCRACGKQALTMCMGLGCNAAGVVGCRILDSPRERMIAMLTNSFVPCNGRYPTMIAVITMFFLGGAAGLGASLLSAVCLALVIVLGVGMTLLVSRILSGTVFRGMPSSFTLELPPYRRPQVGKVLVRSLLDRTLFVLGRALSVAAPAGALIWLLANWNVGGRSLLAWCTGFLDPLGRLLGMDGVILTAFLLGLPANEIVLPLMLMAYTAQGALTEIPDLAALQGILEANGWTWATGVCVILFSLMHWPCSTTCLTVRRESGSWKWAAAAFLIPTAAGMAVCFLFSGAARLLGWG